MSQSRYTGLDTSDIAACYREHAQAMADGHIERPSHALLFELLPTGHVSMTVLGQGASDPRNRTHMLVRAGHALLSDIASSNAEAAH